MRADSTPEPNAARWKPNWSDTQRRFADWWNGKGFIVGSWGAVRLDRPRVEVPDPGPARDLQQQWMDLDWRLARARYDAACTAWPLESLPVVDPWLGPGSMAAYLGSAMTLQPDTVWFEPCITDPDTMPPIRFDPENPAWKYQLALMDGLIAGTNGDYLVGCPDVIENWDTLASLRGAQDLLADMIERPEWVKQRIAEISRAWFEVDDILHARMKSQDGVGMFGHFRLWSPKRVSKVQCDGCSMFSPEMFKESVVPALTEQCDRLDHSMYHLDGSQCLDKLDALLQIETLTAIEWTPDPRVPTGGDPHWFPMYRRILKAGKRLQVLGATPDQIAPLLDACGADGIYFLSFFGTEAEAEAMERAVAKLR